MNSEMTLARGSRQPQRRQRPKEGLLEVTAKSEEEIDLLNPKATRKKAHSTPNYRREYCSQPTWSQLGFEQMMRKQRPEWFKDVAPS
jgi:hypothetical protein